MKVERALALLPGLEAIGPLRALVLASSSPEVTSRWGSAAPYFTVGKWEISLDLLRRGIPQLLTKITDHLRALYGHYADALAAEENGDRPTVVEHLLAAARQEESVGRYRAAFAWGEVALQVAEGLNTRKVEIETLDVLGRVGRAQGLHSAAARHYQRALALAEAESDLGGAIAASEGQGLIALTLGQLQGAAVWLGRAERLAEGDEHAGRRARVVRAAAEVARRRGDLQAAGVRLSEAREVFERLGDALEMAHTLDAQGRLAHATGDSAGAQASFREGLAWAQRAGRDRRVECAIRLHLADLLLALDRATEAEEEMRSAERIAIGHNLGRRLIQIYTRLGTLRGDQGAETGFVFFEQALALCRLLEPTPTLEAEVYREYGVFKSKLGRSEEARGWLERARELLVESGDGATVGTIEEALAHLPD